MSENWHNSVLTGDCFDALADLPAESSHACVTDPPYGLAFMGRDWDSFEPKEYQEWCQEWAEAVKRVLKPGAHLLAFSGNRTHHRLFSGVQDAGFEIRDCVTYHFGSGFPKASDISKTIDKRANAEREVMGENPHYSDERSVDGYSDTDKYGSNHDGKLPYLTEPATDAAKRWDGWKTGLKPATEFVVMARKPFEGATVDCVQEHGTGALNIDGCRVDHNVEREHTDRTTDRRGETDEYRLNDSDHDVRTPAQDGRYPANVVFDEVEAERLDRENGETSGSGSVTRNKDVDSGDPDIHEGYQRPNKTMFADDEPDGVRSFGDSGGPSRYFYTSKASRAERTENGSIENSHPTVKPLDLMEWLVRMVAREGQTVLDPFAGSGTTCKAAKDLGRTFIGIEQQAKYADIARARVGLTPQDPGHVRDDDSQQGLETYTDGGGADE